MFNFNATQENKIFANSHRGYKSAYPENTMHAFIAAHNAGTKTIELDVRMTIDEELVVIHDPIIDRVSTGSGSVEKSTLDYLMQFDYGIKFTPQFAQTKVPLLSQVLEWAVQNDIGLVIELKQRTNTERFVQKIVEVLTQTQAIDNVLLLAFDHGLINQVKDILPQVKIQVVTLARYLDPLKAVQLSRADSVCCEYEFVKREDLVAYKNAGLITRLYLHEPKDNEETLVTYHKKFGFDTEPEILEWLSAGLIDMLSHDDISYLKKLIIKAGKIPA
ncbi:glycerophosphodiester phosphodiesterase family protein [Pasteurella skyensis]|uniref:Glycerophosphodiester phosphodiesterase family protein n=1 Tax=Phocoenobacter skyensis TaxID=97481 RepID=A0AAJ6N7W6_9PAST|nr:glycerophosphodiester phosphodiesterase family protein [Pasteurella skyensis]MDP8161660.1 glycerophosphodiester phosphodiesterase family protein [Pasteurella skyensis]MDP8171816.1 glycerophosphodiester phosphodiesterase family protein [Pasteurella skyensis]MDP8176053.1 glycerophosphodiester phosphodiesterase family protein [Pasteurella skyensis]MDP8178071.1 glycerophosphodiester phosphodiesterase family protein [Pasteurella skyensis]MDP8182319.1 glycerophosphodiester phosphodiesterase famil